MAHEDEKVIVDIRESEKGQILYKDQDGKEHTYYPANYAYFVVENLHTLVVLSEPPEGQIQPVIVRRIRGTARLEDRSLSVVGDQKSKTRTLEMSFEASDWRPKIEPSEDTDFGISSRTFLGGAMLSLNRSDWEIGNDDEWWAACYLPKAFLEQLESAMTSGQLASLRVGLALRGLYSDEGYWAPPSAKTNLFIRPDRKENDISRPEMARGFVSMVAFTTTELRIEQSIVKEPTSASDNAAEPQQTVEPVVEALLDLNARIESTRRTIKWVGGLVVVALLLVSIR